MILIDINLIYIFIYNYSSLKYKNKLTVNKVVKIGITSRKSKNLMKYTDYMEENKIVIYEKKKLLRKESLKLMNVQMESN